MESAIMEKMNIMEKKIDEIANQRDLKENERRVTYDLEEIESPDAK